jgi:LysR family transcriptional regulator, hydrogen peroxide-inducible genes activator
MEIQEIRYFLALSKTLNFTKAAETCRVSQPALTRAIRKLEEELGGLLFSRERNHTHMTELGRLIEPDLAKIMADSGKVKQAATSFLKLDKANLAIGMMCTISPLQFVSFLGRFRAHNPGIDVTLIESVPDALCERLVKGELDVALMARPEGFKVPFKASQLYSERFVIACSAGHRFAGRAGVPIAELDGEFYLQRINCEFKDVLAEMCGEYGAKLIRSFRSEREDWILTMVAAGLGVCFMPEDTASFPGVIGCPVISPTVSRDVCLVTIAERHPSPPVEAFTDAVQSHPWPSAQIAVKKN